MSFATFGFVGCDKKENNTTNSEYEQNDNDNQNGENISPVENASTGLEYMLNTNATYTVNGIGTCTDTQIVIPSQHNGVPVTVINDYAFENCVQITKVILPNSLTYIGFNAFSGCENLIYNTYNNCKYLGNKQNQYLALIDAIDNSYNSYQIHDHTKIIGEAAFSSCPNLTDVFIPDAVNYINDYAFNGSMMDSLLTVRFGNNSQLKSIGKYVFYWYNVAYNTDGNCRYLGTENNPYFALIEISLSNEETTCFIAETTKVICDSAFIEPYPFLTSIKVHENNTVYKDIDGNLYSKDGKTLIRYSPHKTDTLFSISNGVNAISDNAFSRCKNLTKIDIPNSVNAIGNSAFYSCERLTEITIPDSVTKIWNDTFSNCYALTEISIPNNITHIGNSAFAHSKLTEILIPDSVTIIGDYAFAFCTNLTNVVIPDSVTSIGDYAFADCLLTEIIIPDSIINLGIAPFSCQTLTSIQVSKNNPAYKDIDGNLYNKDGTLLIQYSKNKTESSFSIPNGVTTIGDSAFESCINLTNVVIPDSVTSIGYYAFQGCISLTTINIPDGITSIKDQTFYGCSNLTEITLPSNLTSIGDRAFSRCINIIKITIPNSVTTIEEWAFTPMNATLYCEATSKPNGWHDNFSHDCFIIWDCNNNDVATDGYIYVLHENIWYGIKDNVAILTKPLNNILSANIPSTIRYKETVYPITDIVHRAFSNCNHLSTITIGDNITIIDGFTFSGCENLTSITIGNNVTSIGPSAFSNCKNLTSVTIGNSVNTIFSSVFYNCHNLTKIIFNGTKEEWNAIEKYEWNAQSNITKIICTDGEILI